MEADWSTEVEDFSDITAEDDDLCSEDAGSDVSGSASLSIACVARCVPC